LNEFPVFTKVENISDDEELYICGMGFEDRSLGSNKFLLEKNFKTKNTLVIKYDSYFKENEHDRAELEKIWGEFSENYSYVVYESEDRQKIALTLEKEMKQFQNYKSVTINISSFKTHLLIWLINYSLDHFEQVRIIYTEPEGYGSQLEGEKVFASGVKDIFTIPEFAGALLPGYSSLLVIFLGYDFARARGTYDLIQPSRKIGIMGKPNTPILEKKFEDMKKEHIQNFGINDEILEWPIFDIDDIINHLTDIRNKNIENCNISIALNGSKLHAIGALIFAKKFRDVQLIASTPSEYHPSSYSYGVRETYQLVITKTLMNEFLED